MTLLNTLWLILKLSISILLVAFVIYIMSTAISNSTLGTLSIAGSSFCLFLAALPWINWKRPSRDLGLVGLMLSIFALIVAYSILSGQGTFPSECTGRKTWLICQFMNEVYEIGGRGAVAVLPIVTAIIMAWGSYRLITKQKSLT